MTFINYDLNKLVKDNHILRAVDKTVSFGRMAEQFRDLDNNTGRKGYGVEVGIRSVFLQFFMIYLTDTLRNGCVMTWHSGGFAGCA